METPWSRVVEHGEDVPQAIEYELSKEEADAGNHDEDCEMVQAEDQKRQTPKEQDRKRNQEQAADDASDSDAGPVKKKEMQLQRTTVEISSCHLKVFASWRWG